MTEPPPGFKLKCCLPRYLNTAAALCLSRVASRRVAARRGEALPLGRRHSMDFDGFEGNAHGEGLKRDDFRPFRWGEFVDKL